jgi:poly-beta-1,6-N-acetyl-D-glucosamine synthase
MPKIAILITAFREPSIARLLDSIFDPEYDNFDPNITVYVSAPDYETRDIAKNTVNKWSKSNNLVLLTDPGKGKPLALNSALDVISSDWIICTDGDVFLDCNAIKNLINCINRNENSKLGSISGRPKSNDCKLNFWGYVGNLLADAAHLKRYQLAELGESYFASGYLVAYRKKLLTHLPVDTLVDDAQFSCQVIQQDYYIGYEPSAIVRIKYPDNCKDWINQKRRSAGGYRELKKDFPKLFKQGKTRSFWKELSFFWFPFEYATNLVELSYSCFLFPLRLYLWILIWFDGISKKDKLWIRIESTK